RDGSDDAKLLIIPQPVGPDEALGTNEGGGTATDDSTGESALQSKLTSDTEQPMLSRDPPGPGRLHDRPSKSLVPPGGGNGGSGGMNNPAAPDDDDAPSPVGAAAVAQASSAQIETRKIDADIAPDAKQPIDSPSNSNSESKTVSQIESQSSQ